MNTLILCSCTNRSNFLLRRLALLGAKLFVAVTVIRSAFGQGTIEFNSYVPGMGINAPVTLWDGSGPGQGTGWVAQLVLVGSGGNITSLSPATTFRNTSAAASFYVVQPSTAVVVPGVPGGSSVTLRVRAWNGSSFETAALRGESGDFTISLGGPMPDGRLISNPFPIGLQGFTIVPEPSTISLALLGVAVLLIRGRR